jgi:hypothetical protein
MTPNQASADAATLLGGLSDLPPAERVAGEGRLIEELERVIREDRAQTSRSLKVLAAVRREIGARLDNGA